MTGVTRKHPDHRDRLAGAKALAVSVPALVGFRPQLLHPRLGWARI